MPLRQLNSNFWITAQKLISISFVSFFQDLTKVKDFLRDPFKETNPIGFPSMATKKLTSTSTIPPFPYSPKVFTLQQRIQNSLPHYWPLCGLIGGLPLPLFLHDYVITHQLLSWPQLGSTICPVLVKVASDMKIGKHHTFQPFDQEFSNDHMHTNCKTNWCINEKFLFLCLKKNLIFTQGLPEH